MSQEVESLSQPPNVVCACCKKERNPSKDFFRDNSRPTKIQRRCKYCTKKTTKAWHQNKQREHRERKEALLSMSPWCNEF